MAAIMTGSTPAVPGRYVSLACVLTACIALAPAGCASADIAQDGPTTPPNVQRRVSSNVITAEDIAQSSASISVLEILQRYVPGFRLVGQVGRPGGETRVSILGMGSPVFVLDGIVLDRPDMALSLNPRDVQQIEVLKHGASTALLGLRGSEGAVVIETKH